MGCVNSTARSDPLKLMVLGVDNAGKSTFIAAVKGEDVDLVAPTVGFSPEDFQMGQRSLKVYDLGGGAGFRGIWGNYYAEVHGVVYVVDSADADRFETVRENMAKEFAHPRLQTKPVLLLANKKDLQGAKSKDELRKVLGLDQLPLTIHIVACSSHRKRGQRLDSGIKSGIKWLIKEVDTRFPTLSVKVDADVKEYNAEVKREREEKRRLREERWRREEEEAKKALEMQQREPAPAETAAGAAPAPAESQLQLADNRLASPRNTAAVLEEQSMLPGAVIPSGPAAAAGSADAHGVVAASNQATTTIPAVAVGSSAQSTRSSGGDASSIAALAESDSGSSASSSRSAESKLGMPGHGGNHDRHNNGDLPSPTVVVRAATPTNKPGEGGGGSDNDRRSSVVESVDGRTSKSPSPRSNNNAVGSTPSSSASANADQRSGPASNPSGSGSTSTSPQSSNNTIPLSAPVPLLAKQTLPQIGSASGTSLNLDSIISDSPFPSSRSSPKLTPLNTLNTPTEN